MAKKRMFDKAILETDNFLNVSLTAKALYFLLGMEADDEGFVSPKRILRLYGGEMGDLKNLIDSGLVIPFKSGVVVITDWNQNNWLDNRRIRPTQYQIEKKMLILTEQNKYVLSNGLASARLEESSIEEKRVEEKSISNASVAEIPQVLKEFEIINPAIKRMYGNKTQRGACERLVKRFGLEKVLNACRASVAVINQPFAPKITTPYQLETEWAKLVGFLNQENNKKFSKGKQIISST